MALEVESWENRGTDDTPFGYVYFSDGSRVGFSNAEGHDDVWEPRTNGGGKFMAVTPAHLRKARELLRDEGILEKLHRPRR